MLYGKLIDHAKDRPQAIALMSIDGGAVRYRDLPHRLAAMQQWLRGEGGMRGEVYGVAMSNGAMLALVLLGASLAASLTPLDAEMGVAELIAVLKHVGARGVITDEAHKEKLSAVARELSIRLLVVRQEEGAPLGTLAGEPVGNATFEHPGPEHVLLLHRTSGTTGTSKRVPLRALNISTQARNTAESLRLTHDDRIVQVMPLFHMHGFGCLTGTLWSGGTVVCTPGHDGSRFPEWVDAFKPTWLSAAPTILRDIARAHANDPDLSTRVPLRFVRSLSAAIPMALIEELERTTKAPLVEQYGLTEALSPVIANVPPPGPRRLGTLGKPFNNEVRIVGEDGEERATGEIGEIVLRGAGVIKGYAEAPDVNARSWFGEWFRTGDLGLVDDDGFVHLTGRLKEEINRGGEKIGPQEVEEAIAGHPGVKAAAAFATPHPTLGEEVTLAYVPVNGALEADDLRRWMQERIAPQKVPKRFYALPALPVTATGKIRRTELARIVHEGEHPSLENRTTAGLTEAYEKAVAQALEVGHDAHVNSDGRNPATYVERVVAMVWGQELGRDRLLLSDDFFLLGGDSLSGVRASVRLSEILGTKVDLADLFRSPTLGRYAEEIGANGREQRWKNLAPIRTHGHLMPFVCVHGDEGNYNLPRLLDHGRPFYGFMHQGEDGQGMRYQTIRSIARHYVNELRDAIPEGPCILAGFSTGGVIAFEMARILRGLGREVPVLVILDARGPKFNWWLHAPRTKLADLRGEFLRPRCERYLRRGEVIPYKLRNFYVINTYRRAVERYKPAPYAGDVLFIHSTQREHDPTGWEDLFQGNVTYRTVEGSHLNILREPNVRELAAVIRRHLEARGI